jgi:hypothetical protein
MYCGVNEFFFVYCNFFELNISAFAFAVYISYHFYSQGSIQPQFYINVKPYKKSTSTKRLGDEILQKTKELSVKNCGCMLPWL